MPTYGPAQLAAAFRNVRKNTIQVAEDIPEDKYDFVAAPGVQPVRAMLAHIAFAPMMYEDIHRVKRLTSMKGYDFAGAMGHAAREEKKPRTKAELIALLQSEGDRFADWLDTLTPDFLAETVSNPSGEHVQTRLESLLSPKEHEMHHRAQLMLVERLLGIVPHLTRRREEFARQRAADAAGATAGAH